MQKEDKSDKQEKPLFIADDRGHLLNRRNKKSSFPTYTECGAYGFDFTPVVFSITAFS